MSGRPSSSSSSAPAPSFQLEGLERRTFLSAAPVQGGAADAASAGGAQLLALREPAPLLNRNVRQALLNHWNGPNRAELQQKLDANKMGAFDGVLLNYMRARKGNAFFWNSGDVAGIKSFINTNLATANTIENADHIAAHRFPNGNSENHEVQLGGDINWSSTTSNPDFIHTLNRHAFWLDLAQAHVVTGNAKYVNELIAQLSDWSADAPPPAVPDQWEAGGQHWQPFSVAVRADSWTWAYQMVLSSSAWTSEANTLMLYKLWQHGDFLRRVTPYALDRNRALFQGEGLLEIGHLVSEFAEAGDWRQYGHGLLFSAMDAQLNPDGGHAESSPGYAGNVITSLLEMYYLDQRRGEAAQWTSRRLQTLENAAKAHAQLLSPNAQLTPLSDTYRGGIGTFWNRPRVILNNQADFPAAKARLRDVWLFGTKAAQGMLEVPINPGVPARPDTYSMPQSGYYVMRSGSDVNARQITFDAGPTGGGHGHFDLLSFELFGHGKPLISDPGLYAYDDSARRKWAVSTPAHNTISVDGRNHAALEGVANPNLWSSGISQTAGGYQVTASHGGYADLAGAPGVSRSIWFDGDGVMLVADLGTSSTPHNFATSFLLPGTNTSRDLAAGWIRSNNASGNVKIQALLQPGQSAHRQNQIAGGANVFVSNGPDADRALDATRFSVEQNGSFAGFFTLITTYAGKTAPNITAKLLSTPPRGYNGGFAVQIYRNGKEAEVIPFFARPRTDFRPEAPNAGANDIAFDSDGRLHMVYNDRDEKNLKYSVRDAKGRWSIIQTIDPGIETGGTPSLAQDSRGNLAVAYFDGDGGDLKFARLVGGAWQVEKVDSAGSVGLYGSLVFSRDDVPMISYYHRTRGDLRLAVQHRGGWKITTVDSDGDVGRSTSMALDPNRPGESALAIAYDGPGGIKKFALQTPRGWSISTVDNTMPNGGGSTSLAYEPFTAEDKQYHPTMSYYDSSNTALKFARFNGRAWQHRSVISSSVQGLYTNLFYDSGNTANIFFFKKSTNRAYRARGQFSDWKINHLGTGGREIQTARRADGAVAWTNLDKDGLRVELLPG